MSTPTSTNDLQDVMDVVREQYAPSDADKDRIYKAVIAAPVIPVNPAFGSGVSTVTLVKGIGVIAVIVLLATVGYQQVFSASSNDSADRDIFKSAHVPFTQLPAISVDPNISIPDRFNSPVASVDTATTVLQDLAPEKKSRAALKRKTTTRVSEKATPETKVDTLAAELRLISQAAAALNQGDVSNAKMLLRQHRSEFPRGVMTQERNGLEIIALCKKGQTQKAIGKYQAFKQRSPNAPILMRIQTTCEFH